MVSRAGSGSKKFVYVPPSADDVKSRIQEKGRRFDSIYKSGFDTFRPRDGSNYIRILPPTWEGYKHHAYDVWVHAWVGPDNGTYVCPQKMGFGKCAVCEEAATAMRAADSFRGSQQDKEQEVKAAKKLFPARNPVMWVLYRDDKDRPEHPILYRMSGQLDTELLNMTLDDRTGKVLAIADPNEGYDINVKRSGKGLATRYTLVIVRDPTPMLEDE